ncbi:MAG: signal peptidase I, partial [Chlamydiae bacterium RIFCSPHIGHO2_12_FULL_49_11]
MIFQTVRLWKLRRKTKKIEKTFIQHRHRLANQDRIQIDALINETFSRISRKDAAGAITSFEKLNEACHRYLSLPLVLRFGLYTVGLAVTIVVALIIRQTWFELYEIPSGSMRPTLKENDRLAVSKTTFGLNIPMKPKHLFFDEKLPKRGSIVVFTGNGMNIENNRTNYFYLFPGYKQYVKRLIGLPGDSLYFYGGKIYGIDKEGQDTKLHEILTPNEHIPFIYLEGNIRSNRQTNSYYGTSYIYQMNSPIAKITEEVFGHFKGSLISKQKVEDLYELYGMENFATSRIVPKEMVSDPFYRKAGAEYFLELTHHPSIRQIDLDYDHALHHGPRPHVEMSYIPLSETQLRHIFDALYSARFQVIGGR